MPSNTVLVVIAIVIGSLFTSTASSSERVAPHDEIQESIVHLRRGDCPAAWKLLWPLAKAQNRRAFTLLAESLVTSGMNPPGLPKDDLGWKRTYLILALYGYDRESGLAGEELINLLRSYVIQQPDGSEVAQCLERNTDHSTCVKLAVTSKIVPSLSDFIREVDQESVRPDQPKCRPTRF
ncbi:hypothetical protein [Roseibium album]|uniref:hypothetical protein n=1 Tax=Roseibium album TaxID=311410 RepID=UPI0006C0C5DB|nr:hypothetical protein [Roseibium album]CTQ78436.1 hypothetical protein LA5095_04342 [Roseibium album]